MVNSFKECFWGIHNENVVLICEFAGLLKAIFRKRKHHIWVMIEKCEFNKEKKSIFKQGILFAQTSILSIALAFSLKEVYDCNTNQLYFYMSNLEREWRRLYWPLEQYGFCSLLKLPWFYFLLSDLVIQRQQGNLLFLLYNSSYHIQILSLKKMACACRCNNKMTGFMTNFLFAKLPYLFF